MQLLVYKWDPGSRMGDGNHISRVVVKLCKENKELKEELDDTLNDCVNQDKELNQLNEELKRNEKEFKILSTHYEEVKRISSSRYDFIGDLRKSLDHASDRRNKLLGDNMKLSEEIDSMTSGEDSLSLEELKDIKFCVNHFQLIFPNLFHKLTSMIERHDVPTPKEMTVEEIEKQLGHSIKVVK